MIVHRNFFAGKLLASALLLGVAVLGLGQTIQPKGTMTIKPLPPLDTRTLTPQIYSLPAMFRVQPENPNERKLPMGAKNSLVAGSTLNLQRGNRLADFPGPVFADGAPPDCDMAVGPKNIITIVNSRLAVYSKTGTKQLEQPFDVFFKGMFTVDFLFDPKAFYDPDSKQFFILIEEQDDAKKISAVYIAVTKNGDPNGVWNRYKIDTVQSDSWLDYPGFGCSKDNVVVTGNMFPFGSGGEFGARILSIPKSELLAGGTIKVTDFFDPKSFTDQVARSVDGGDAAYMVESDSNTTLKIFAISGGSTPILNQTIVAVPQYFSPPSPIIGPNGSLTNTHSDERITVAAKRGTSLLAAHTVSAKAGDAGASVRWYEFDTKGWPVKPGTTPILVQSGNVSSPTGEHYHEPGIHKNFWGDISVYFSRTSSSINGDIMFAARKKTDAPGTMGIPVKVQSSQAIIGTNDFGRWGDYAAVCIDPSDDQTFWGFTEYTAANRHWATWVQKWTVTIGATVPPLDAYDETVLTGSYIAGTSLSVQKAGDSDTYLINSVPIKNSGQVTAGISWFNSTIESSKVLEMTINTSTQGPTGATVMVYAYNFVTKTYDWLKSGNQPAGSFAMSVPVPGTLTNYVAAGTNKIQVLVKILNPVRKGVMPGNFTGVIDFCQVIVK